MDVLLWSLVVLLIVAGIAGTVLPMLPGTALVFAGLLLGAWIDDFTLVSAVTVAVLGVLTLISWAVDYLSGVLGAKKVGVAPARPARSTTPLSRTRSSTPDTIGADSRSRTSASSHPGATTSSASQKQISSPELAATPALRAGPGPWPGPSTTRPDQPWSTIASRTIDADPSLDPSSTAISSHGWSSRCSASAASWAGSRARSSRNGITTETTGRVMADRPPGPAVAATPRPR